VNIYLLLCQTTKLHAYQIPNLAYAKTTDLFRYSSEVSVLTGPWRLNYVFQVLITVSCITFYRNTTNSLVGKHWIQTDVFVHRSSKITLGNEYDQNILSSHSIINSCLISEWQVWRTEEESGGGLFQDNNPVRL